MSDVNAGVPLKKRRIVDTHGYYVEPSKASKKQEQEKELDNVICIDDDEDDESDFSSPTSMSNSQKSSPGGLLNLNSVGVAPPGSATQGMDCDSPGLNTQPSPAMNTAVGNKQISTSPIRSNKKKKKAASNRVSMSPGDSLAKLGSDNSTTVTAPPVGDSSFRLTKQKTSSKAAKTDASKKAKTRTKETKNKRDASKKKGASTAAKTSEWDEDYSWLDEPTPTKRSRKEIIKGLSDDKDHDDLLNTDPIAPSKKPKLAGDEEKMKSALPPAVTENPTQVPITKTATKDTALVPESNDDAKKPNASKNPQIQKHTKTDKPPKTATLPAEGTNAVKVANGAKDTTVSKKAKSRKDKKASESGAGKPESDTGKQRNKESLVSCQDVDTVGVHNTETALSESKVADNKTQPAVRMGENTKVSAVKAAQAHKSHASDKKSHDRVSSNDAKTNLAINTKKTDPTNDITKKGNRNNADNKNSMLEHGSKNKVTGKKPNKAASGDNKIEKKSKEDKSPAQGESMAKSQSVEAPSPAVKKAPTKTASTEKATNDGNETASEPKKDDTAKERAKSAAVNDKKEKLKVAKAKAADAAKKKKKVTFQEQVLRQMVFTCKPYTLATLAKEMNITEQQLNFTILSMLDKGLVIQKDFTSAKGRTKTLLWANLESKAKEAIPLEFSPTKYKEAHQEVTLLSKQEKDLQQELANVTSLPGNQELKAQVENEEVAVSQLKKRLADTHARIEAAKTAKPLKPKPSMRGFQAKPKSEAQLAKERCPRRLKMRINAMRQEWKTRKTKTKDFIDTLSDAMEKKPKEVVKILDIETDEDTGVSMPPKYQID